ncbi:MAG: hypothetical protein ACRDZ3_20650 [Acidimicrobiia bacterium]
MSTALVTGAHDRTAPVASALRTEGFETLALDHWSADAAPLGPGSLNCYIQMPGAVAAAGANGPALVARVDAVAALSPFLADHASVLLVADDLGWDQRRRDALALLAEATLADRGPEAVKVAVLGEISSTVAILERVRASHPTLADLGADLSYADWRTEVFNMTGAAGRIYFGWQDGDGHRRVAVLRGAVMSPLRATGPERAENGTPPTFDWGTSEAGAHLLARALVADAVGSASLCPGCSGHGTGCARCTGHGLTNWADTLADVFLDEVVVAFPQAGFELPVADVATWLDRRLPR